MNQRFFTLIEIIAALAIIILISAISYPFLIRTSPKLEVRNVASKIIDVLHTARIRSSLCGHPETVVYDPKTKTFEILDDTLGKTTISDRKTYSMYNSRYSVPKEVRIVFPDNTNIIANKCVFHPDGTAVALDIRLKLKTVEATISISGLTGIAVISSEMEQD